MEKKEAMKILKEFHDKSALFSIRTALDTVIPELKESEDEIIRKEILNVFKQLDKDSTICGRNYDYAKWIDWLEKQGEQKSTDNIAQKIYIEKGKWYVCIQSFNLNCNTVVEKGQTYKSREDNVILGENDRLFIDKHDGDASKYFRLWTIQDAKDGDIIYDGDNACIFRQKIKDDDAIWVNTYCGIHSDSDGAFSINNEDDCWCLASDCAPATKEQRDLLFQKMKEAGYEWDAENKELKKIEQKPQTELPKGEDYAIDGLWQAIQILEHSLGEVDGWQSEDGILEHRCAIEAVKRLYEQKSAWSEEDDG